MTMKQEEKVLLKVVMDGKKVILSGDTKTGEDVAALFEVLAGMLSGLTSHDYTVADLYQVKVQTLPAFISALVYQLDNRLSELGVTNTDGITMLEEVIKNYRLVARMKEEGYNEMLKNAPKKPSDEKKNYN